MCAHTHVAVQVWFLVVAGGVSTLAFQFETFRCGCGCVICVFVVSVVRRFSAINLGYQFAIKIQDLGYHTFSPSLYCHVCRSIVRRSSHRVLRVWPWLVFCMGLAVYGSVHCGVSCGAWHADVTRRVQYVNLVVRRAVLCFCVWGCSACGFCVGGPGVDFSRAGRACSS